MRIDRELRDLDGLLSQHALDGDADLAFIEHERLCVEDAPTRQHVRIDPDGRRLPAWIDPCLPNPLLSLQAHHVRGGQIRATPRGGNRVLTHVGENGGARLGKAAFIARPAHGLAHCGRRELRNHACRLGCRH